MSSAPHISSRRAREAAYVGLCRSGELQRRAECALARLADCDLCPRNCRANRLEEHNAVCRTGRFARVCSYGVHFGEEACLSGTRGSGTVFFAFCNLRCVFCQNYEISWLGESHTVTAAEMAGVFLELQDRACHNINLVTPSHVVPQILEALQLAAQSGLHLPLVYNTSAYDSLETLALLDGVVDIYMPDFKYWDSGVSRRYSKAADYPEVARRAIKEMQRQVGPLVLNENGIAVRGVLLRHLVMPGGLAGTFQVMHWIAAELGANTYVNLMAQYHPAGRVGLAEYQEIDRCITSQEMDQALGYALDSGLRRIEGWPRPWA